MVNKGECLLITYVRLKRRENRRRKNEIRLPSMIRFDVTLLNCLRVWNEMKYMIKSKKILLVNKKKGEY